MLQNTQPQNVSKKIFFFHFSEHSAALWIQCSRQYSAIPVLLMDLGQKQNKQTNEKVTEFCHST